MIITLIYHDGYLSSNQGEECPFLRLSLIYYPLRIGSKGKAVNQVHTHLA